jgi:3-dehydroshikimate dehydratase
MILTGLVSVTFRKLSPSEVIKLVQQAGLYGIEWGGDVHVPHGDINTAKQVAKETEEAGLQTISYGSYYRVGEPDQPFFEKVLETAVELHTDTIRVWPGRKGSEEADEEYRTKVIEDSRRIAELAGKENVTLAYEFHPRTLTDTDESAVNLLRQVDHPNMKTYWQPPQDRENIPSLKKMLPWLVNVHVNSHKDNQALLLAEAVEEWEKIIQLIRSTGRDHAAMIEFVKDGKPEIFLEDAKVLKNWLT